MVTSSNVWKYFMEQEYDDDAAIGKWIFEFGPDEYPLDHFDARLDLLAKDEAIPLIKRTIKHLVFDPCPYHKSATIYVYTFRLNDSYVKELVMKYCPELKDAQYQTEEETRRDWGLDGKLYKEYCKYWTGVMRKML